MASKKHRLSSFLLLISSDEEALHEYEQDPEAFMKKKAKLTEAQIAVVKSKDPLRLGRALLKELGVAAGDTAHPVSRVVIRLD